MMRRRGYYGILLSSVALLVFACVPMRMGVQEATLEKLLEQQVQCDALQGGVSAAGVSDKKMQKRMMVVCQNNAVALEKASGEFAAEAKGQRDPANQVFWYNLAATAGWKSQSSKGMQDAITYADEGARICNTKAGMQPGDCAYMYVTHAFVANEISALEFRKYEERAKKAEEELGAEGKPTDRKRALQAYYLKIGESGATRIEEMASTLLRDAWLAFQDSWETICKVEGIHPDVIKTIGEDQNEVVENLKTLHDRATTLPLNPGNTDWIVVSHPCKEGELEKKKKHDLIEDNRVPAKHSLAPLDKKYVPAMADETSSEIDKKNMSLMERAMVHTYCAWQYAQRHTKENSKKCK
jgi:hypothetical protein